MNTNILFYDKLTNEPSNCGAPLDISASSRHLKWQGVLVERGTSPYFYPKDVTNPDFYFAIELESAYEWMLEKEGNQIPSTTEPGDIWINPPNTPFTHNIDEPCNFLIVTISEEVMYKHFDGVLPEGLKYLNNYNIQDRMLENLMSMMLVEAENNGINDPWLIDRVVGLFSNYFIRHYSNYNDLMNQLEKHSIIGGDELFMINRYIMENMSQGITIDDLANSLNISKFHFLSEFKKFTGYTPYQHLTKMRINMAKKLLLEKELSITAIAHDLGFSDNSHFSRSFKKALGVSPKSFRENPL